MNINSSTMLPRKMMPRLQYYHTVMIPTTTSSGTKLFLPLEISIVNPKNLTTCCSLKCSNQITAFDPISDRQFRPNTWPLSSTTISKRARLCICNKISLHYAVKQGRIDKVEELLNKGVSLGAKDDFGKVPIHYIQNLTSYDSRRILDVIWLRITQNPDDELDLCEATGLSLIHLACLRDDYWAVKRLLKEDKSLINTKTLSSCSRWPSYSPLHFAVIYSSQKLIGLLLESDADPNNRDRYGYSPAHLAIHHRQYTTFHMLVDHGADPYARTYRDLTPFRLALQTECPKAVEAVLEYTFDNPMDNKGSTPLHYCCEKGLHEKVTEFLENGTDPDTRTHLFASKMPGYSPLHVAVERKDLALMRLLLSNNVIGDMFNGEVLNAAEMIHNNVKDKVLKAKMNDILKEYDYYEDLIDIKVTYDWWYCVLDNSLEVDESVLIEIDPKFKEASSGVLSKIQSKAPYKKYIALTRKEMSSLFFKYGKTNSIVKKFIQKNGSIDSKILYKSFDRQDINKKIVDETVYHYYIVNDTAFEVLIDFGFDLGNHKDEIHLGDLLNVPKCIMYQFFRNMETRRLLGLGGKHEKFWKDKISEERSINDHGSNDIRNISKSVMEEIKLMKKLDLGSCAGTLFDVVKDEHKFAQFLYREPNFVELFHTHEFSEKLPNCMSVVRMQCHKAVERLQLIKPAMTKLKKIIVNGFGINWLNDCSDLILPYLSDEDMKNLIMA